MKYKFLLVLLAASVSAVVQAGEVTASPVGAMNCSFKVSSTNAVIANQKAKHVELDTLSDSPSNVAYGTFDFLTDTGYLVGLVQKDTVSKTTHLYLTSQGRNFPWPSSVVVDGDVSKIDVNADNGHLVCK
jgi:hypothetical protein